MKKLSKKEWIAVCASLVFVVYAFFGANIVNTFKNIINPNDSLASANSALSTLKSVLINDIVVGRGPEVKPGQVLSVHYILSLADGSVITDSKDLNQPLTFVLGDARMIPGFDQGFVGMKVGGVRTIIIPPELGYGKNQAGPIPPDSTLVFTVQLIEAK